MLGNRDVMATLAVKDLGKAKAFYEGIVGLKPVDAEGDEAVVYRSGNTSVLVYRSRYAGTNQATALTWAVGDALESIVQGLKTKGVRFEHYEMPDVVLKGDVHVMGDMKSAWFKDPDGNILALVSR